MAKVITRSVRKTQKVAAALAKEILKTSRRRQALVLALEGNLGSGKTTFVQGFARALGIKENVLSPTFVLIKAYPMIGSRTSHHFRHLVHIDCYRLESPKDLLHLGFWELLKDKDAIILIEWADRVRKLIPQDAIRIKFKHGHNPHERIIDSY
jgi:tRNA threonylcarbamoyladenosine biosynthesis protein TsaE